MLRWAETKGTVDQTSAVGPNPSTSKTPITDLTYVVNIYFIDDPRPIGLKLYEHINTPLRLRARLLEFK